MFIIGVVLLIIGIALVLAPVPYPNVDAVGWLLALVGVVLIIVSVLLNADVGNGHALLVPGPLFSPFLGRVWSRWRARRAAALRPDRLSFLKRYTGLRAVMGIARSAHVKQG